MFNLCIGFFLSSSKASLLEERMIFYGFSALIVARKKCMRKLSVDDLIGMLKFSLMKEDRLLKETLRLSSYTTTARLTTLEMKMNYL